MRILAFDQSLTATAAVLLETEAMETLAIREQWICRPKNSGIYRMMEIRGWMDSILRRASPDMMVREMHHMRQFGAAGALQGLSAVLDMLAYEQNYLELFKYAMIAPGTWKKFCTGKGNLKKDTSYLMTLNKFFKSTTMLFLKPDFEVDDDNIADAICMGITGYFGRQIKLNEQLSFSKAVVSTLSKATDKMFDYGSI